ncbi:hypothetical protein BGW42_002743 [Actinomortierella wolfii]|nr:hypothetical protein BGW42_002743 [Actinomortierella wolfii]
MVLGIGFPYTLPTTGNVSFQDLQLSSQHALHRFQTHLSDATAFRGRLRAALKEHKHSANKDYINIQKAIEDYIPYLLGLLAAVESGEIKSGEIETTWRCTLSNTILSTKQPRVKNKSIYYEAVFTFLTLGYVLMDRAREHVLGAQTVLLRATGDPSVSSTDGTEAAHLGLSIGAAGSGIGSGIGGSSSHSGANMSGTSTTPSSSTPSSVSRFFRKESSSLGGSGASGGGGGHTSSNSSNSGGENELNKKAKLAGSSLVGDWIEYVRDEDMAQIEATLKMAVDLYCRAAGVFSYIVEDILPRWNHYHSSSQTKSGSSIGAGGAGTAPSALSIGTISGLPVLTAAADQDSRSSSGSSATHESSRPIDVQTAMIASHIRMALGEAHACSIQKASLETARARAQEKVAAAVGGAGGGSAGAGGGSGGGGSGSSSSGSKFSFSLLAKLSIGVKEEYERAYGLIKAIKDLNEISTDFRSHAKDGKLYYEAMAQTFLGIDAYETGQYGKAVAFMSTAQGTLASLSKSSKSPAIAYASHVELYPIKDKAMSYQKINDSVAFEPLTPKADLLRLMPSGRDMFKIKKYTPPTPAFGLSPAHQTQDEIGQKGAYALQGAYF